MFGDPARHDDEGFNMEQMWQKLPRWVRCVVIGLAAIATALLAASSPHRANAAPTDWHVQVNEAQRTCQGFLAVRGDYTGTGSAIVALERLAADGEWTPASWWGGAVARLGSVAQADTSELRLQPGDRFELEQYQQLDDRGYYRVIASTPSGTVSRTVLAAFASQRIDCR